MSTRVGLTYSDYAALPDDGRRYELHQGELSVTPSPGTRHQDAVLTPGALLREHVKSRGLGKAFVAPTDCILSDMTVVQPDVLYVATDRLSSASGHPTTGLSIRSGAPSRPAG